METLGTCGRCGGAILPEDRTGRPVRDPDDGELYHNDCWEQEVRG